MQTELIFERINVWNKSIKIFLNRVVWPAVFVWLSYSIYRQIVLQPDLKQSIHYIADALYGSQAWKFWMVVSLMMVNWLMEARKWQVLMSSLQQISLWRSFKATLAGVAFAVNTPNRIGEYGGRMLYVEEGKRLQSVPLTIVGSIAQLIVTLVMGLLGWLIIKNPLAVSTQYSGSIWMTTLQIVAIIFTISCIVLYFRLNWLLQACKKLKLPQKIIENISFIGELNVRILLRVLALSFGRYLVFVYQYILILQLLHVDASMWQSFWLITILYLILALIPTVALLELGVRGKVGILLFQTFSANTVGIYAASTGIWLINLILPALAGTVLAAGFKIFNTKK